MDRYPIGLTESGRFLLFGAIRFRPYSKSHARRIVFYFRHASVSQIAESIINTIQTIVRRYWRVRRLPTARSHSRRVALVCGNSRWHLSAWHLTKKTESTICWRNCSVNMNQTTARPLSSEPLKINRSYATSSATPSC